MKKGLKILFSFTALAVVLFGIHLFADSSEAANPEKVRFYKEMTIKKFRGGVYIFKISRITMPLRAPVRVKPLPVPGVPIPPGMPDPRYQRPFIKPMPVHPVRAPVHPIIVLQNKLKVKMLAPIDQIKIEHRSAWDKHALAANMAVASMLTLPDRGSSEKISKSASNIENQIKTINDWLARADALTMGEAKEIYDHRKRNIERKIERLKITIPDLVSQISARKAKANLLQKMQLQIALATAQASLDALKELLKSFLSKQEEMIKKEFGDLKIQQNIKFQANIAKLSVLNASLRVVKGLFPNVKAIEDRYRKAEKTLFKIYKKDVL